MLTGLFSSRRKANPCVRLQDGTTFPVANGETLLEAALRSGLRAPHSCRVGACTTCRCRILDGKAKSLIDRAYVLQPHEIDIGVFLACQTLPVSDLVVEWEIPYVAPPTLEAVIVGARQLTPRVWRVSMSVDNVFQALPGQYVDITIEREPGVSLRRPFSLVTVDGAPKNTVLEIDVARRSGGNVSSWLTGTGAVGAGVRIGGPFGTCVANEGTAPLIALGAGSGIGAAVGVLCYTHQRWPIRSTALLAYGAQTQDIYGLDDFSSSAVVSGARHFVHAWAEQASTACAGISLGRAPTGLVAALSHLAVGTRCEVLLYGPPGFVDCCVDALTGCGIPAERIRYDRYQPAINQHGATRITVPADPS